MVHIQQIPCQLQAIIRQTKRFIQFPQPRHQHPTVFKGQKRQQETDRFLQAAQSMRKLGFTTQELIVLLQKEEEPHD